jgi:hypothetical protein
MAGRRDRYLAPFVIWVQADVSVRDEHFCLIALRDVGSLCFRVARFATLSVAHGEVRDINRPPVVARLGMLCGSES